MAAVDFNSGGQAEAALRATASAAHPVPAVEIVTATPAADIDCRLSIVIPAYNEENRLPATLERVREYLAELDITFEVLIVDDGSRDATRELGRAFVAQHSWARLVHYDLNGHPLNRGKGYAVRQGVLHAIGKEILFSDADLSTPIEEMEKLLAPIRAGECEVSIASRAMKDSNLAVHQPWYRELMGRGFNLMVQAIAVPGIVDTQCGFKAFRGDVARRIFSVTLIDGFGFDTEVLFLARKFGYRVRELPVTWRHMDDSRVSPLSAPIKMFSDLLHVRYNNRRGAYDKPVAINKKEV